MNASAAAPDPRVYFAAERTMLAWLRTGITIMAFGFVIARFGLFLRLVQAQGGGSGGGLSPYLGRWWGWVSWRPPAGRWSTSGSAPSINRPPGLVQLRFVLVLSWAMVIIGAALTVVLLVSAWRDQRGVSTRFSGAAAGRGSEAAAR
jgi:uncharacterized membrane protein YidH (DUF202 family)